MKITPKDLLNLELIDGIISEPLGGAHSNPRAAADLLKTALLKELTYLQRLPTSELLERRYAKLRIIGTEGVIVKH